jgi:perosamine synthetase
MMVENLKNEIQAALPKGFESYALHEPMFAGKEEEYVLECLKSRWVSYQGRFVKEFEQKIADFCSAKHAIAVSSGTVALYLALKALDIKEGSEVIIPSLTFVATANAVMHTNCVPHLVDANYQNLGIDISKLEDYLAQIVEFDGDGLAINRKTKRPVRAIIPVHIFGHPVDLNSLLKLAQKYNLQVIEDAAEGIGSYYHGRHVGTFGDIATLSFNGNKVLTTGGGGALLTNDDVIAERLRHISTTAKVSHPYEFYHDEVGYNFRMPNINAALGVAQLEQIKGFLEKKQTLAKHYENVFASSKYFDFFSDEPNTKSNYWLQVVLIKPEYSYLKNELLELLHTLRIACRPIWMPMHKLPMYQDAPQSDLSSTDDLHSRVICLPSSPFLVENLRLAV